MTCNSCEEIYCESDNSNKSDINMGRLNGLRITLGRAWRESVI